jgi:hypothetical protein
MSTKRIRYGVGVEAVIRVESEGTPARARPPARIIPDPNTMSHGLDADGATLCSLERWPDETSFLQLDFETFPGLHHCELCLAAVARRDATGTEHLEPESGRRLHRNRRSTPDKECVNRWPQNRWFGVELRITKISGGGLPSSDTQKTKDVGEYEFTQPSLASDDAGGFDLSGRGARPDVDREGCRDLHQEPDVRRT